MHRHARAAALGTAALLALALAMPNAAFADETSSEALSATETSPAPIPQPAAPAPEPTSAPAPSPEPAAAPPAAAPLPDPGPTTVPTVKPPSVAPTATEPAPSAQAAAPQTQPETTPVPLPALNSGVASSIVGDPVPVPGDADATAAANHRFYPLTPQNGDVFSATEKPYVSYACGGGVVPIVRCALIDHNGEVRRLGGRVDLAPGEYTWIGIAVNADGVQSEMHISFRVEEPGGPDTSAPVISSDWAVPADKWTDDTRIDFTAEDPESGVESIYMRREGITTRVKGGYAHLSLHEGTQTIEYFATNNAGLESQHGFVTVNVDTVSPVISATAFGTSRADGRLEVLRDAVIPFSYSCSDERSGIVSCFATVESGAALKTSDVGEYELSVTAIDRAGNEVTQVVRYVVVEPTEPTEPSTPTEPGTPTGPTTPGEPAEPGRPASPGTSGSVSAPKAASGPDALASTGQDAGWLPAAAASLLLMGLGAALLRRTRKA